MSTKSRLNHFKTSQQASKLQTISFACCPAKTFVGQTGESLPGRNVIEHCQIVGETANALVENYPSQLRSLLFPQHTALVAACHDIGKVSPTFYEKLRRACTVGVDAYHILPDVEPSQEKLWGGHAGVSMATVKALNAPEFVPEILGQHHGFSPQLGGKTALAEPFGGAAWQQERVALVGELKRRLNMDWPQIADDAQARLVAGLTSVADWIGSGHHFENPDEPWQSKITQAVHESGFVPANYQSGLSFEQVFGFAPRPAQKQLIQAATGPGVYVLEAPMGLGKTEAALFAAYQMLQTGQACGVYFALPTQLTSNKIHERFNQFLQHILTTDCPHRSALLLHGKAWLQENEMGEEGRPGGAWFNQAKRGLLAPFAVGTLDQALMAAMNVKHGFVRAFGLAGKVVILDEVHTYDAYTGTLLDALIKLLRSLQCTVIVLSATLNQQRRIELLQSGPLHSKAYPLITAVPQGQAAQELAVVSPPALEVQVQLQRDEKAAIQEVLDRAAQGQQVLWLENTVGEAQERYLDLAARAHELGVACGLLHSRFTAADRNRIEAQWVVAFGKEGWPQRTAQGRILVGTQVLEQSLDIDADFLVSRFAPTDMLLQRLGRLWRHADAPRAADAVCEAWLLAPDLASAIKSPTSASSGFGASAFVYAPYVLCRSLEVWQNICSLKLPEDIRPLIEATYTDRQEQDSMARWLHELDEGTNSPNRRLGRNALRQLARIGLAQDGKTLPESKAQTRYSETDSHEVLLLKSLHYDEASQTTQLTLLDGQTVSLPTQRYKLGKTEWKDLTARLTEQMVLVRPNLAPQAPSRERLKKLGFGHCFYLGDPVWAEDESLLRIALVDETGRLKGLYGQIVHDKRQLYYHTHQGYLSLKPKQE